MSDDWTSGIVYAELSDVGMRRANNQDSSACVPAESEERFQRRGHLFVVADGMGAHAAGELASRMATEKIAMHYFRSLTSDPVDALRNAVLEANAEIHQRGQSNPEFHNMGTTASALAILPDGALVAHVGDSRVYRLRGGCFEQLTFDHSLVWEMEASGHSDSGTWGSAIPKNVITRSLGPNATVDVDVEGPFGIAPGDRFLLCSDGLTGLVDDTEIGTLLDCLPEDQAARVLVDLANLRGGPDNTTVVIVGVDGTSDAPRTRVGKRRGDDRPTVSAALWGSALACLLGAAALGVAHSWGPMIVAFILATLAGGAAAIQWYQLARARAKLPTISGGKGPYRRYDATPSRELYDRLGGTVQALRDAAKEKSWTMDWGKVNEFQTRGEQSLKRKAFKDAIELQAKAVIETMNQLRQLHNRSASETAIDH